MLSARLVGKRFGMIKDFVNLLDGFQIVLPTRGSCIWMPLCSNVEISYFSNSRKMDVLIERRITKSK